MKKIPHSVFFGTPNFAVEVLETLLAGGFTPSLLITSPDAPKGRGLISTPPPVKLWTQKNNIPFLQPSDIKSSEFVSELEKRGGESGWDFFLVAAYGHMIPKEVFGIPRLGTFNIHPSLLPHFRGASPIQAAILAGEETGVTVMKVDEKMDHGPIVVQEEVAMTHWPLREDIAEYALAKAGGSLFLNILPELLKGGIALQEQDDSAATYTKPVKKEDGLVNLEDEPKKNYRKFLAYFRWPGVYFFTRRRGKPIRVVIKDATLKGEKFIPLRVIPEGKREISFEEFLRGL